MAERDDLLNQAYQIGRISPEDAELLVDAEALERRDRSALRLYGWWLVALVVVAFLAIAGTDKALCLGMLAAFTFMAKPLSPPEGTPT